MYPPHLPTAFPRSPCKNTLIYSWPQLLSYKAKLILWYKLESCFIICIWQDAEECSRGADSPASHSPQAEQSHPYLLLLLLPLLTGFLFGTALEELLGKLLGLRSISKVGSDVVMDLIGRLHFLQERNKRGNCKKKADHEWIYVDSKHTHAINTSARFLCQIFAGLVPCPSQYPTIKPYHAMQDETGSLSICWIMLPWLPEILRRALADRLQNFFKSHWFGIVRTMKT